MTTHPTPGAGPTEEGSAVPGFRDPIGEAAAPALPAPMVAAALSQPNGAVRVLAGTALAEWIAATVQADVTTAVAQARRAWITETSALAEQAALRAAHEQITRWDHLIATLTNPGSSEQPDHDDTVRRTTILPRTLATALKSAAAARGMSQQDAITEAVRGWITANTTTNQEH